MKSKSYNLKQMLMFEPSRYDIKCGQDKALEHHFGNQLLRSKIIESVPKYQEVVQQQSLLGCGSRKMKSFVIKRIVHEMQVQYGSRFLRYDCENGVWIEINDKRAHEKVSHSLRTYIRRHCSEGSNTNILSCHWENEAPSALISPCASPVNTVSEPELSFGESPIESTTSSHQYHIKDEEDIDSMLLPQFDNSECITDRLFDEQQKLLHKYLTRLA
jgi:hypothetical protein